MILTARLLEIGQAMEDWADKPQVNYTHFLQIH
jgi:hypothetical protein